MPLAWQLLIARRDLKSPLLKSTNVATPLAGIPTVFIDGSRDIYHDCKNTNRGIVPTPKTQPKMENAEWVLQIQEPHSNRVALLNQNLPR